LIWKLNSCWIVNTTDNYNEFFNLIDDWTNEETISFKIIFKNFYKFNKTNQVYEHNQNYSFKFSSKNFNQNMYYYIFCKYKASVVDNSQIVSLNEIQKLKSN
jgi:hypothetical protein